jgi:hypothetical protein
MNGTNDPNADASRPAVEPCFPCGAAAGLAAVGSSVVAGG